MTRKGVLVSINSDSAEHSRRLNTEAAKSIKWGGLYGRRGPGAGDREPGATARVADRVGSIEPGKDADLVVWNHHPLSSYAVADRIYIDGDRSTTTGSRRAPSPTSQGEGRAGPGRERTGARRRTTREERPRRRRDGRAAKEEEPTATERGNGNERPGHYGHRRAPRARRAPSSPRRGQCGRSPTLAFTPSRSQSSSAGRS